MARKEMNLNPIAETNNDFEIDRNDYKDLIKAENNFIVSSNEDEQDSFFKSIVNKMFDNTDTETKTEYINTKENFVGAKLTFLARYGNIPYLEEFINIFERKRISLERKGRKEIIMALEKRQEEIDKQRESRLQSALGI